MPSGLRRRGERAIVQSSLCMDWEDYEYRVSMVAGLPLLSEDGKVLALGIGCKGLQPRYCMMCGCCATLQKCHMLVPSACIGEQVIAEP